MKHIFAWFDRHPKTRIALQLVLDGLPFLWLVIPFATCIFPSSRWTSDVMNTCLWLLAWGGVPIFLLGIWLHKRAEKAFVGYPKCETFSDMLRVLSAIATLVSFGFLVSVMFGYIWTR